MKTLKDYMRKADRDSMHGMMTTHSNCIAATGVARPGKTARDRYRREHPKKEW